MLASGLTIAGAAPASAVEHRSGGLAELVNADTLGLDVADAFSAETFFPGNEGPDSADIDAAALEQLVNLNLGGISVPLGLSGAVEAGLLNSYSQSSAPTESYATSGAVGSDGSVSVNPGNTFGYASVDLTSALSSLGLGTEGLVDDLSLQLGALATTATSNEGGTDLGYTLAGSRLSIDAPALDGLVSAATGDSGVVAELDTTVNNLAGSDGTLQSAINGIGEITQPVSGLLDVGVEGTEISVTTDLQAVAEGVLTQQLTSDNGSVVIDLGEGQIYVDLAAINGGSLNGLDPNTPVLSSGQVGEIVTEVTSLLTNVQGQLETALTESLENSILTVELDLELDVELPVVGSVASTTTGATVSGTLLQFATDAGQPTVAIAPPTFGGSIGTILNALGVGSIGELVTGLLNPVLGAVVGAAGDSVSTALEATDEVGNQVDGIVQPVLSGLTPVLQGIENVVSVTVNVQPDVGDLGEGSDTVRAVEVQVLPGTGLAGIRLASSTAYSQALGDVFVTSIGATDAVQGGSTTVVGEGFAAEESVTVSIPGAAEGDDPITETVTTDAEGEFTVDLPIPGDYPTGEVDVTAVGEVSETPAEATFNVTAADDDGDEFVTSIGATDAVQGGSTRVVGEGFAAEE
ncbi:choice-of-anchor G family protein, partial [Nesterenkonia halotolerans]|uniref:choice-of-anchor G family protein n=1 Tax=Nesterenkonia halotolerans TaxID=225325 RepID=UPI003639A970